MFAKVTVGVVVLLVTVMPVPALTLVTVPLPLLLKVFQSVLLNKPVVLVLAVGMFELVAAVTLPCASMVSTGTLTLLP